MKKLCLLLALVLLLAPAVRADVIVEPEDSFYWAHRGECVREDRIYTAHGPENVAVLYQSPESGLVRDRVPNGEVILIDCIYEDENGIRWGLAELAEDSGWVPMEYLVLVYDNQCFLEEFAQRILWRDKVGKVEASGAIRFWAYPGSEDCVEWDLTGEEYLPEYTAAFEDDGGRSWVYVEYYYGHRSFWVCLDAPAAPYYELYKDVPAQTVTQPEAPEPTDIVIVPPGPSMGGILTAVGVLAALCAGFLLLTRKKKTS